MKPDETEILRNWNSAIRVIILSLLFFSAFQFLAFAIVIRAFGTTEDEKLIFAGCMLLAGIAFALGVAFRKSGAPTWKHKVAVALVAAPAAVSIFMR